MMESTISRIASGGVLIVIVPTPSDEFRGKRGSASEHCDKRRESSFGIAGKTPADELGDDIEHSVFPSLHGAAWRLSCRDVPANHKGVSSEK